LSWCVCGIECKFCFIFWALSYFIGIYRETNIVIEMNEPVFEVVFHHGGKFFNDGSLEYVGENNTLSMLFIEMLSS